MSEARAGPLPAWPVLDADSARAFIAAMQARLAEAGQPMRAPPPEPDPLSCCGRGCVGCVWSGFYDALGFWREDALALLACAPPDRGGA